MFVLAPPVTVAWVVVPEEPRLNVTLALFCAESCNTWPAAEEMLITSPEPTTTRSSATTLGGSCNYCERMNNVLFFREWRIDGERTEMP